MVVFISFGDEWISKFYMIMCQVKNEIFKGSIVINRLHKSHIYGKSIMNIDVAYKQFFKVMFHIISACEQRLQQLY